ncbi:unnamed protein product [Lasius platythorax]|uniref:Uncharacterized protein n=1 Tax=Lasius platythorax TaxID=488582 RepID=A0AAV2N4B1_9HYME
MPIPGTCKHTRGALIEASAISVILRNEKLIALKALTALIFQLTRNRRKIAQQDSAVIVSFHHSIIEI